MADESTPFRYDAALAGRMETEWQARWEREGTYRVGNPGDPGFDATRPKFYALDMFPYPSGAGLHVAWRSLSVGVRAGTGRPGWEGGWGGWVGVGVVGPLPFAPPSPLRG